MESWVLDRTIEYKGVTYRVLEVLTSDHLLVVEEIQYRNAEYPLSPYIIPGS